MATENKEVHFFSLLGSNPKPTGPKEGFPPIPMCAGSILCSAAPSLCRAGAPPFPPLWLGSATGGRGALLWSVLSLWIWIKFPLWLPLMYYFFPVICYSPHTVKCGRKDFRILQRPQRPCACAHTSVTSHTASLSRERRYEPHFKAIFSTSPGTHSLILWVTNSRICAISKRWRHRMRCSLERNSCTLHNLFLMGIAGSLQTLTKTLATSTKHLRHIVFLNLNFFNGG